MVDMRKILVLFLCVFLIGCSSAVVEREQLIDVRYIPEYEAVETTYENVYDFWNNGFKKMPNIHTVKTPERYEGLYEITYDNGKVETEWREISQKEYSEYSD